MIRRISPSDFGAQMVSRGGFTGRGEQYAGTQWQFPSTADAKLYQKALGTPQCGGVLTDEQAKLCVKLVGGKTLTPTELSTLNVPTKQEERLYSQLVETPSGEIVGKKEIGLGTKTVVPQAFPYKEDIRNYIPAILVGICILFFGYFLFTHMRSG